MNQDDRIEIYTIPPNFAEEGTMLSGRIRTRNAVETALILMVLVPLLLSLDAPVKTKMYLGMIVIVPIVILGIIGVQGESLFAFVAGFFHYLGRRRYLTVPDEQYRLEQNRRKTGIQGGRRRGKRRTKESSKPETGAKPDLETGAKADPEGIKAGEEKREPEEKENQGSRKKRTRIRGKKRK